MASIKLKRKVYESVAEKRKDFIIGIGVFIGLNVLLSILSGVLNMLSMALAEYSTSDIGMILSLISSIFIFSLPFLINFVVLIYFLLTRTWIGVGMLGTIVLLLIFGLVLGVIVSVVCFGNLVSGSM